MIPPRSCQAPNALNLGAVDIMSNGRKTVPLLGMDHRAIVWCHNLLSKVREIIFTLNRNDDKDAPIRLREVANRLEIPSDYNYLDSVERTRMVYVVRQKKNVVTDQESSHFSYNALRLDRNPSDGGDLYWRRMVSCT